MERPRLTDRTVAVLDEIGDEYQINTRDKQIRAALREAGYDI